MIDKKTSEKQMDMQGLKDTVNIKAIANGVRLCRRVLEKIMVLL